MNENGDLVLVERRDSIACLTLNRPAAYNALNSALRARLRDVLVDIRDDEDIRAVIVTGAGKAFSAGADLDEIVKSLQTPCSAREGAERGQVLFDFVERLGKPVIAAINGHCLGAGCELALACTVRIASTNAKLGLPEIKLGVLPAHGGIQRLFQVVGRDFGTEMILTGESVASTEAYRAGLVSYLVEPDELLQEAEAVAARFVKNGRIAVQLGLEAIRHALNSPAEQALAIEAAFAGLAASTEDSRERLRELIARRQLRDPR